VGAVVTDHVVDFHAAAVAAGMPPFPYHSLKRLLRGGAEAIADANDLAAWVSARRAPAWFRPLAECQLRAPMEAPG
jgi:hypothetical protein